MCMKAYGYSIGDYRDGFMQHVVSLNPVNIKGTLRANCQVSQFALADAHGLVVTMGISIH